MTGSPKWTVPLPKGSYLSVGLAGASVLVHALQYSPSSGVFSRNCMLQVDPASSAISVAGLTESSATTSRLTYVGDGLFARSANGVVEVWSVLGGVTLLSSAPVPSPAARAHVDRLTRDLVALTSVQGDTLTTFSLSTSSVAQHRIGGPILQGAQGLAQSLYAKTGMSSSVRLGIIPVTGCAGDGTVQAMVFPHSSEATPPLVSIDASGSVTSLASCQPTPGLTSGMTKLIVAPTELGVVYFDGTVLWYAS